MRQNTFVFIPSFGFVILRHPWKMIFRGKVMENEKELTPAFINQPTIRGSHHARALVV